MSLYILGTAMLVGIASCRGARQQESRVVPPKQAPVQAAVIAAPDPLSKEEKQFYRDVARSAWAYFEANYQPSTGLVSATPNWYNTTLWDVGGQIIAFESAKELGLISADDFDARMRKTLGTLEHAKLFENAAYNKEYSTKTGDIASERVGWSTTDLGRFLLALKLLATKEPQFAAQAERIARRNDFGQLVRDGYLYGELIGSNGKPWAYQEGRIGYEQYVARGFAAWGADVHNALDVKKNAKPLDVMGVQLLSDRRSQDRLLSEPFILYGLELGLDGDMRDLAQNVLKAQEARYKSTGTVTIATEDAVSVPPDYFYYYCVYCNGQPFTVAGAASSRSSDKLPRWVSTKAAFGWNALMPDDYTKAAVDYVSAARDANGRWASGVYEGTKESTKTFDINTAAVMMEVALYRLRGDKPLMEAGAVQ